MSNKKAFDLGRDSVYVAEPITELRICGAKGLVPPDEAGDLDTVAGPDVPVKDLRRLRKALIAEFKESVDKHGVRVPIIIAKIDDVATVLVGKRRVRAARAANRNRKKKGLPLMKLRCVMQRDAGAQAVLATIILENNQRQDDDLADRIEKLKAFVSPEVGGSLEDATALFGVKKSTLQGWLDYDDNATEETKKAVKEGKLPPSSAGEVAKIKDPDAQNAALAKLLAAPGVKDRSARAAKAARRGANGTPTATDRRSQVKFFEYVVANKPALIKSRTNDRVPDDGNEASFWHGVIEAFKLVTGKADADPRLVEALAKARE